MTVVLSDNAFFQPRGLTEENTINRITKQDWGWSVGQGALKKVVGDCLLPRSHFDPVFGEAGR
jgi:hypothetical protein